MFDQKDGALAELVRKRYQSFDTEIGAQIEVTLSSQLFLLLIYI
jgi:xylose isomerase